MELKVPEYGRYNGEYKHVRNYDDEYQYLTFELNDYIITINDMNDVKNLVKDFKKPTEYVNFVNFIKTSSDLLPLFQKKKDDFKELWKNRIEGVPKNIIDGLKHEKIQFQTLIAQNLQKSMDFLKQNITNIENLFRDVIEDQKNKIKQSRKDACKRYYLKKKQELNITFDEQPEKVELTEEEIASKKIEARKEACRKYYLKKKQEQNISLDTEEKVELNDEEIANKKIEARKETNRKYYQKIKNKLHSEDVEEDKPVIDFKERKKLYNQKYYQSKKDKLLQLSQNENQQL